MVSLLHWSLFRITAWAKTSKGASDRFIMSAGSALALNAGLKVHYRDKGGRRRRKTLINLARSRRPPEPTSSVLCGRNASYLPALHKS